MPHLACLLARLLLYIHRHVSRYVPLDVPCRRTQIRRNLVELFLTVILSALAQFADVADADCKILGIEEFDQRNDVLAGGGGHLLELWG